MQTKTKQIVLAALLAALAYAATTIIKIPSPLNGYLNLGDCVVLTSGWILSPGYGFLAAGLGSALADLLSGYVAYAPATFLIKGCMALLAGLCQRHMQPKTGKLSARLVGGVLAETAMVLGYFIFEGFLYGFAPSLVNIPANGLQGLAGLILGLGLIKAIEHTKITLE